MKSSRFLVLLGVMLALAGCEVNGSHPLRVAIDQEFGGPTLFLSFGTEREEGWQVVLDGETFELEPVSSDGASVDLQLRVSESADVLITDIRVEGSAGFVTMTPQAGLPGSIEAAGSISLMTAFGTPGLSDTFDLVVESDAPDPEFRATLTISRE